MMSSFWKNAAGAVLVALLILAGHSEDGAAQQAGATPTTVPPPTATPEPDWDVPNGRFFTQAGGGTGGFTIADDGNVPFWSSYRRIGGVAVLGYPASRRFSLNGFTYQATQAALLQWRAQEQAVVLGNTFELLQQAGKDDWLLSAKGIPRSVTDDGSSSYAQAVQIRLGWLTDPAIRTRYLANPNASNTPGIQGGGTWTEQDSIQLYGLPMSRPERSGPTITQRFQRIAFQLWVEGVPGMPSPGTVTPILGGDLLKETGIITGVAAVPHSAAAVVSAAVTLGTPANPTPVSFQASETPTQTAPQRGTAAAQAGLATATARALAPTTTPRPPVSPVATARPGTLQAIDGTLSEYSIYLPQLTVKVGTVRFSTSNVGAQRHNLRVVGPGVDRKTVDLRPGQSGSVDVTFVDPGTYTVYCDIADHESLGMTAVLNVE